jgi:ribosome-binding protein aMBF1 (putative translation factor)
MNEAINYQTIQHGGTILFVIVPYGDFLQMKSNSPITEGIPHSIVEKMTYDNISRIRAWREHLGFTQQEVAEKMGITQAALSQIETKNSKPRKTTLEKLAKVLGLTAAQLR